VEKDLTQTFIEALWDIFRLRSMSRLGEFLQGETLILAYLDDHREKAVHPSELSKNLGMTKPRVTAAVSALSAKGCVLSKQCENDGRMVELYLTEKGSELIREKREKIHAYFTRFVKKMEAADILELTRLIGLSVEMMKDEEM